MLEKATKEDIATFQSYTIRSLDQHNSISPDIDQYKMLNVKEKPLDNRQAYLDVMCFPNLFPSGHFDVFATGMAYVALSRVRTLEGLHLVAFDPKSIKVNLECIEEVNRLRKTLTRDLPSLKVPDKQTAHKHKVT